jgi:hypothetical protein
VLIGVAALLLPVEPAAAATPCGSCVGVIGDSLTLQGGQGPSRISAKLAAAGFAASDIRIDAKTGRSIAGTAVRPSSLEVIRAWRAAGFDPALYVVALGTNNKGATVTAWRTEIGKVLAEIGPGRRILWIGLGFRDAADPRVARFNATLADIAATRTDLVVREWNNHVHSYPQTGLWASSDRLGIHMTTAGYNVRNDYYVAAAVSVRNSPG